MVCNSASPSSGINDSDTMLPCFVCSVGRDSRTGLPSGVYDGLVTGGLYLKKPGVFGNGEYLGAYASASSSSEGSSRFLFVRTGLVFKTPGAVSKRVLGDEASQSPSIPCVRCLLQRVAISADFIGVLVFFDANSTDLGRYNTHVTCSVHDTSAAPL